MKVSVGRKLLLGFSILLLIMVAIGGLAINRMQAIHKEMELTTDYWLKGVLSADEIIYSLEYMRGITLDNMMTPSVDRQKETFQVRNGLIEEINNEFGIYEKLIEVAEDQQLFDQAQENWKAFLALNEQVITQSMNGQQMEAYAKYTQNHQTFLDARESVKRIVDYNRDGAVESGERAMSAYQTAWLIMIIMIVAGIVIGIIFATILTRSITTPLTIVTQNITEVANGNLMIPAINVKNKDELGTLAASINSMVERLQGILGDILNSSHSVSSASEEISASTEEIASGSSVQSDSAQVANEQFRELSQAIDVVAKNAEVAAEMANEAKQMAVRGSHSIESSVQAMNELDRHMEVLQEDSNKIGEIIEVIDDIADQTNLLALNAAIEAARAGEQGRGFAVVADEIRRLAERSGEATKQIATIIKGMQEDTRLSVEAVHNTMVLSQQTGEAFSEIVHKVVEAAAQVNEIAAASEEQAAQSSTVLGAIESIAAASEEAAAASEETAAATQTLSKLAEEMNQAVSYFKI